MNKQKFVILLLPLVLLVQSFSSFSAIQPRIIGGTESDEGAWPFMTALMYKDSAITIEEEIFDAIYIEGTPNKSFSGVLSNCDQGFEVCADAVGKICLIERGETFFAEKIDNCDKGGGIAAIIYNHEEGFFFGKGDGSIPAVGTNRASGLTLLNHVGELVEFGYLDTVPTFSYCGGSYIGGRWIVTAAHCVDGAAPDSIALNIGGHNLNVDQENIFSVADISIHRDYDFETLENDIALIELTTEPKGITPVTIADQAFLTQAIENNSTVTTIGRGLQTPLGFNQDPALEPLDPRLFEVNLNLVDNESCNQALNDINPFSENAELVAENMVCAGNLNGGMGSCLGDSGGPLIVQQDDKNYLVGLTSWGFGCAQPDVYGVYGRVPFFKNTIETVLNDQLQTTFISTKTVRSSDDDNGGSLHISTLLLLFLIRPIFRYRKN